MYPRTDLLQKNETKKESRCRIFILQRLLYFRESVAVMLATTVVAAFTAVVMMLTVMIALHIGVICQISSQ